MKSGIYEILCVVTNKVYIGSTIDFNKRFREHRHYLNNSTHHSPYLQRSWNKHKAVNFQFRIVEIIENPTKEKLLEREQFYLDNFNPIFNVSRIAGSPLGVKHTDKFKEQCRIRQLGRVHTKEHNKKISESNKNRIFTDEHKRNISLGKTGKKDSDEKNFANSFSHRNFEKWPCSDGIRCTCVNCKKKKKEYYAEWRRAKAKALEITEGL